MCLCVHSAQTALCTVGHLPVCRRVPCFSPPMRAARAMHCNPATRGARAVAWTVCAALVLVVLSLLPAVPASASQLFFTSTDGCARSSVGFSAAGLSAEADLTLRAEAVLSQLQSTLAAPSLSCPAVNAASSLPRVSGVVCYDFAGQRMFDVSVSYATGASTLLPTGPAALTSRLRITSFASSVGAQLTPALSANDEVLLMQFQPSSGKLVAIIRNYTPATPTLALVRLDPAGASGAIKTQLMDLAPTLGSASIVSGLSALDTAGNQRLMFATSVSTGAGSNPVLSVAVIDLATLTVSSHSLGASTAALDGMVWIPALNSLMIVRHDGAALYNPSTQATPTVLASVSAAVSAIATATGSLPSSLHASAYLSSQLFNAVSSAAPSGSTPLAYADLLQSGLVSMLVQSDRALPPMLLLVDPVNDRVRIEVAPRSRAISGVQANGFSEAAGEIIGLTAIAATPSGLSVSPQANISAAGGDAITISGSQLYSLPLLAGASVQCEWIETSGLLRQVPGTLLSSTSVRCVIPTIPPLNSLLQVRLRVANESVAVGEIGQ